MSAEASEFLKKPYTRILIPDEESGTFTARIAEFPGCVAQGNTPAEAYERLEAAAESWIEAAFEMRQVIPPPTLDAELSGRFALRLPRSLHRRAAEEAELDGTSLNQFIVSTLAEKVGAVSVYRKLTLQFHAAIASAMPSAAKLQQAGREVPRRPETGSDGVESPGRFRAPTSPAAPAGRSPRGLRE